MWRARNSYFEPVSQPDSSLQTSLDPYGWRQILFKSTTTWLALIALVLAALEITTLGDITFSSRSAVALSIVSALCLSCVVVAVVVWCPLAVVDAVSVAACLLSTIHSASYPLARATCLLLSSKLTNEH